MAARAILRGTAVCRVSQQGSENPSEEQAACAQGALTCFSTVSSTGSWPGSSKTQDTCLDPVLTARPRTRGPHGLQPLAGAGRPTGRGRVGAWALGGAAQQPRRQVQGFQPSLPVDGGQMLGTGGCWGQRGQRTGRWSSTKPAPRAPTAGGASTGASRPGRRGEAPRARDRGEGASAKGQARGLPVFGAAL